MNSKNSKTSDPHRLLHYITDKKNLKRTGKYIALSYHALYMGKYKKDILRTTNLRYQPQYGMKNLNYLMDHILYQIFNFILSIFKKTWSSTALRCRSFSEKTSKKALVIECF